MRYEALTGGIAGIAGKALEAETGRPVLTDKNAVGFKELLTNVIETVGNLK